MGHLYYCKCDNCGYYMDDFAVGHGFSASRIRERIERQILLGYYGHEIMNLTCQPHTAFLLRMPVFSGYFGGSGTRQKWCKNLNVARSISKLKVEQSNEIFVCKKCGDIQQLDLIELFDESQDSDKPVYTYKHHCEKCYGVFEHIVLENGNPQKEVLCPQCKKALTVGPCGHWD